MSRNYKFHNPRGLYFVSFAVVNWIDVFIRNEYKQLLVETLNYYQANKSMEIIAWCIMSSHVHLIFRVEEPNKPEMILGDFKRYTSRALCKAIMENPKESRKEWMLEQFKKSGETTSNTNSNQFWQHNNKPIELWSNKVITQKINYVHQNPVEEGYVIKPEEYLYSSARDYAGEKGLVNGIIIADIS